MFRNNPIVYLARMTWRYSAGNRRMVVLYAVLFVLANVAGLFEPLIVAKILNTIQADGFGWHNARYVGMLVLFFPLITLIFWAGHGTGRVLERNNAFFVRAHYKQFLLNGVMGLPIEWHTNHHSGDTIDKIQKGTEALHDYAGQSFIVIQAAVRLLGAYIALVAFNVHAAYLALGTASAAVLLIARFDRILVEQYRRLNHAENTIAERIYDAVSNITTVIILRAERLVAGTIFRHVLEPYPLQRRNNITVEGKWFAANVCGSFMIVLVIGSYLYQALRSGSPVMIGTISALYGYVIVVQDVFFNFAYRWGEMVRERSRVANAEEIAADFPPTLAGTGGAARPWRTLAVRNLSFSYHTEEGADLHLDGIAMTVKKGERIALVGRSGSGKTTLLKIIRELYRPKTLDLSIDGRPEPRGFAAISAGVSLIPQDPEIFATTIRENITLGVDYDNATIRRFTDLARFTEVAERLPKKLESSIVEKGVNLSGGEKQRLALARGLLASEDKDIVLLDEPTSSVDTGNELAIYENIFRAFRGKTVISSIHRLHLLPLFDTIYFFRGGRIAAAGSFKKVLAASPEFKRLWARYAKAHRR